MEAGLSPPLTDLPSGMIRHFSTGDRNRTPSLPWTGTVEVRDPISVIVKLPKSYLQAFSFRFLSQCSPPNCRHEWPVRRAPPNSNGSLDLDAKASLRRQSCTQDLFSMLLERLPEAGLARNRLTPLGAMSQRVNKTAMPTKVIETTFI